MVNVLFVFHWFKLKLNEDECLVHVNKNKFNLWNLNKYENLFYDSKSIVSIN